MKLYFIHDILSLYFITIIPTIHFSRHFFQTPPSTLEDLLLPTPLQSLPDVVVVGTQETNGERDEWEFGLQETLGPGHVLFHSIELGTIHLAVFIRRDLIWVCSSKSIFFLIVSVR